MYRGNLNDLLAFLAVAQARSFTKAAAKLGVSQSALSHTIRGLEEQLGLRLLTRTTRSVAPTEAGARLIGVMAPRFEEIEAEITALGELRDKPAGTIRLTATDYAIETPSGRNRIISTLISGYRRRNLATFGHRIGRRALRCRRTDRRAGGEGHDRRADRAGHSHRRRRGADLFRNALRT
jgi:DNA-binding transcriptional LysR family regulator